MSSPGKEANILNLEQKIARLERQLLFEKTELSGYGLTGNFKREAIVSTINQLRSKIKNIKAVETERRIRIPTHREPTHPGEMLLEEFLKPMGMTQKELSEGIKVPYQRINEIINGKRGVTPSTALRLAKFFGTSEDFWLNLQLRWDLYRAMKKEKDVLRRIKPLKMKHKVVMA